MAMHDNSWKMTRQEAAGTPTQFDMFADGSGGSALRHVTELRGKRPASVPMTEDEMVAHLTGSGRYRVLEKLEPRPSATFIRAEFSWRTIDRGTAAAPHEVAPVEGGYGYQVIWSRPNRD